MKKDILQLIKEKLAELKKIKEEQKEAKKQMPEKKEEPTPQVGPEKKILELSPASVAKSTAVIIILLLLALFLYEVRDILVIFFVSFLLAAALDPSVNYLNTKKVPRSLGVIILLLGFFLIIGLAISNIVPIIADQIFELAISTSDFFSNFEEESLNNIPFIENVKPYIIQFVETIDFDQVKNALLSVSDELFSFGGNIWEVFKSIGIGLFNILMILILTFFMVVEEKSIDKFILSLFPSKYANYITTRTNAAKEKIGYWLRGQLMLSVVIGILAYIGLKILGVNYAATLALIAGITELLPYIGPIIAWLVTVPIAANQSPWLVLWVSVLFIIIQMLENNVIVPLIMKKAVGLSPIIITFAILVGEHFLGFTGIILSIPVATTAAIFIKDYTKKHK